MGNNIFRQLQKSSSRSFIHFFIFLFFFSFSLFNVHSSSLISRLFSFFEQQNVSELMDFSRALPFEIVEKILRVFFFFSSFLRDRRSTSYVPRYTKKKKKNEKVPSPRTSCFASILSLFISRYVLPKFQHCEVVNCVKM